MTRSPLVALAGVGLVRGDGRTVFEAVDLEIRPGDRVGLIGPNGAGKTSLLHLIVGLLPASRGEVVAFGRPRRQERDFAEVRRRVGLLFQDSDDQLFCPTVGEDVAFGPRNLGASRAEAAATVARTLQQLGLAGFEERITYRLSGGEKRRVALATVLAMAPEVLLLDEPTTGLDEAAEARMLDMLAAREEALVVVSHDRRVIERLSTRVLRLEPGGLRPL